MENFAQSYKCFKRAKQLFESGKCREPEMDAMRHKIEQFIRDAEEWEVKKRIGYIS